MQLCSAAAPFLGSASHATLCKFEIRHGCSRNTMQVGKHCEWGPPPPSEFLLLMFTGTPLFTVLWSSAQPFSILALLTFLGK